MSDDTYEFGKLTGVVATVFLIVGISLGFVAGQAYMWNGFHSTYDGLIDKENYEQVMVRETIDAFNASIKAFEANRTDEAYELAQQGNIHLWGLMHSFDKSMYEPIFKKVSINCFAVNEERRCKKYLNLSISNLQKVQKYLNQTGNSTIKEGNVNVTGVENA